MAFETEFIRLSTHVHTLFRANSQSFSIVYSKFERCRWLSQKSSSNMLAFIRMLLIALVIFDRSLFHSHSALSRRRRQARISWILNSCHILYGWMRKNVVKWILLTGFATYKVVNKTKKCVYITYYFIYIFLNVELVAIPTHLHKYAHTKSRWYISATPTKQLGC